MIPVEKLLSLFPRGLLSRLAVSHKVDRFNQIRLPGEAVFMCLLNTLASHSVVTQRLLEETYTQIYGRPADHSSFGKRLVRLKPAYFQAILNYLHQRLAPLFATGAGRGLKLRRTDATTVTFSAKLLHFGILQRSGNREDSPVYRHMKAVMTLGDGDLPDLLHICREQCEANDNCALGDTMLQAAAPGDLWVFDAGCKDRDRLLRLHRLGAYWLTPHAGQKWRTLRGVWVHPLAAPPGEPAPRGDADAGPPVGPAENPAENPALAAVQAQAEAEARQHPKAPAPCLLLRVEQVVFENAEDARHPSRQAKWAPMPLLVFHAERYSHRLRRWEPLVLLTNLPLDAEAQHAGPFTLEEVPEVYRDRWDMEGLFKFLKQHLSYGHLTSLQENGIQLMVLMTLIMALLLLWYRRETGIDRGWRSVKSWFAYDVREWTATLLRQASAGAAARTQVSQ